MEGTAGKSTDLVTARTERAWTGEGERAYLEEEDQGGNAAGIILLRSTTFLKKTGSRTALSLFSK